MNPDNISLQHDPFPPRLLSMNDTKRIGRNKFCFCGSGVKFKKCCMKKVERLEDEPEKFL